MIIREIRIHAQLLSGLNQNLQAREIATATKIHPFVVNKTLPTSKNFTISQIKKLYDHLFIIDTRLKSGGITMTADDTSEFELAIEKFIIQSCAGKKN